MPLASSSSVIKAKAVQKTVLIYYSVLWVGFLQTDESRKISLYELTLKEKYKTLALYEYRLLYNRLKFICKQGNVQNSCVHQLVVMCRAPHSVC